VTYRTAILKRNIELLLMYPFVLAGKLLSPFFRLKKKHQMFIFSPSADIGGSIQVNIDLCHCFRDYDPLVIFSKKPKNNQFLSLFNIEGVTTIDLHRYVDHKGYHFINFFYRGVIASWINKTDNPVVIGGESLYFYKVLPHIKKEAQRIDICHLNTWFNYSQAFIKDLDARVFSTAKLKRDAEALYAKNHLPQAWYSRLHFIDNKVPISDFSAKWNEPMQVVFIGRGAPQKRVHLIAAIAKRMHEMQAPVHFSFVGDVENIINYANYPFCTFYGNIKERSKMEEIYRHFDVLLLTSAYEGLPIAVMEMMAHGKVVVSTAVDGIPDYITNDVNGFLIENFHDENRIIDAAVALLTQLAGNKDQLARVGAGSREYAAAHFSGTTFCESYRKVIAGKAKT
jgi:L-malate glycosyltransferase